jgi:hypothetical protein
MPKTHVEGRKVEYTLEKLDGGLNTRFSPSDIGPTDSPDCLNVMFDIQGSVTTRDGSTIFNTTPIGSFVIDGLANFNGTMVAWAGGSMWRASGNTFVTVASAQSVYVAGNKIAHVTYQNLLFNSDGVVSYKYDGAGFFQMGIAIPTQAVSAFSGANGLVTGSVNYKVAYFNTQAVEGQLGTGSTTLTLTASAIVSLTSVQLGAVSHGVNGRYIYRSNSGSAGVFKRIGTINDNTTTTFTDNNAIGTEGVAGVTDGTAPTPFTTIAVHKDRLFFDDSTVRSLLRYTEFSNPFISEALDFLPINTKSGRVITAIGVQQDIVTAFMDDDETWVVDLVDPSDDTMWEGPLRSPVNHGIAGPRAFVNIPDGILFVGKRDGKITGIHIISGTQLVQTADRLLHSDQAAKHIENLIKGLSSSGWDDIAMDSFNNQVFVAIQYSTDTNNNNVLWFDVNRMSDDGDPGSWSLWSGISASCFVVHGGNFYFGRSTASGLILKLFPGVYSDNGTAINSYWWSRFEGFGPGVESYVKDFRRAQIWYSLLGAWNMNLKWRVDGDSGVGSSREISLNPGGSVWNSFVWGSADWGGGMSEADNTFSLGSTLGRRIQIRFDNQNIAGQAFKVHRYIIESNLRGKR